MADRDRPEGSEPDPMGRHPDAHRWGELDRRAFLGATAGGSVLALTAARVSAQEAEAVPLEDAERQFFQPHEWALMLALCDTLIPAEGEGPGALEARVPVFIDRQLASFWGQADWWYMEGPHYPDANPLQGFQSPLTMAQIFRGGIEHFDDWCRDNHGAALVDLDAKARHAAVTELMDHKTELPPELRDFPDFLLTSLRQGYLSDPRHGGNHQMLAWKHVGYPGARGNFLEWTDPARDNVPYPLGPVSIEGDRG
ncbi:gluconate 2-dehydrogenase subunit 3 family protein [Paracoccus jeotgali]|uniref:gluconate 2-dehydrogenase subunit 3 family protein n=1 Tax=Paracoccus jeotgali TaxID=2065379 RepID=UPI0028A79F24|nr:gluconate 2-dehydrogenase subunit 3 family protein [Paracoccus jeotgali]